MIPPKAWQGLRKSGLTENGFCGANWKVSLVARYCHDAGLLCMAELTVGTNLPYEIPPIRNNDTFEFLCCVSHDNHHLFAL